MPAMMENTPKECVFGLSLRHVNDRQSCCTAFLRIYRLRTKRLQLSWHAASTHGYEDQTLTIDYHDAIPYNKNIIQHTENKMATDDRLCTSL